MIPSIHWGWYFLLGILIIGYFWWIGHPQMIDRPTRGRKSGFDWHSKYHVLGTFLIAVGVGLMTRDALGAGVCAFLLFLVVEIGQKYPRDRRGGFFEWTDVFPCNFAGALLGMLLIASIFGWTA